MESSTLSTQPTMKSNIRLLDLPSEIHMHIASFLSYPDALALKHSCRHFYSMVYTGVHLKVDWLVERFERKLECPMEKCSFRTDEAFCNGRVRRIMERRRWHLECRPIRGGCWVVEGQTCQKDLVSAWMKMYRTQDKIEIAGKWVHEAIAVAAIAFIIKLIWMLAMSIYADTETQLWSSGLKLGRAILTR